MEILIFLKNRGEDSPNAYVCLQEEDWQILVYVIYGWPQCIFLANCRLQAHLPSQCRKITPFRCMTLHFVKRGCVILDRVKRSVNFS